MERPRTPSGVRIDGPPPDRDDRSSRSFLALAAVALLAGGLLPAVTLACSRFAPGVQRSGREGTDLARLVIGGLAVGLVPWWFLLGRRRDIEAIGEGQARDCDGLPERRVGPAIVASAALGMFLELAVIRWQGTVFELFAFYKNLSLLACFLGLGLGYALAGSRRIPLAATIPLVAFQVGLLLFTRHGLDANRRASLAGLPVREQLNMGVETARAALDLVAVYWFLATVFLLTALAFVPLGQLCGRLMDRRPRLRAYGLNLLGSLLGVALMLAVSDRYLPPQVWFAVGLGGLLAFQLARRPALVAGVVGVLAVQCLLSWPTAIGWERIYSPYQLLERGQGRDGLPLIRAAGHYYQRIHNLSRKVVASSDDDRVRATAAHYEFPYRALGRPPRDVAIVGAGTGNDVAAALRMGAGRVVAVEIDPAIVRLGKALHPEEPYHDPRVRTVIDDARTFLRNADRRYDLIVYGLLDSHTLLSHASSVRLDSFVYTVEGLREARARLEPGGVLSLSFSVLSPELGRKIYLMLAEAFDGRPPRCIRGRYGYDGSVTFLQSEGGGLALPGGHMAEAGFADVTSRYADPTLQADASTDDWPFFYMPRRIYPTSYLGMVALILAISVIMLTGLTRERPTVADARFFFLGAGFMLVETKAITELGLAFGNTWKVIGIAIGSMLAFAFAANVLVARSGLRKPRLAFVLLLASVALGLAVARAGGVASTPIGRIGTAALLTCPVFFSGLAFSTLLAGASSPSRVMAANLFGALCGGLLEYNAMYFGFRSLYWLTLGLYALAALGSTGTLSSTGQALARRPGRSARKGLAYEEVS